MSAPTTDRLSRLTRELIQVSAVPLADLARLGGMHWTSLSRWSRGVHPPSPAGAQKLARALQHHAARTLEAASRLEAEAERRRVAEGKRLDEGGEDA